MSSARPAPVPVLACEVPRRTPHGTVRRAFLIGGIVGGLLCAASVSFAPRVIGSFSHSKRDIAMITAKKLALEAYPSWRAAHAQVCPSSLDELLEYVSFKGAHDPWGTAYELLCGEQGIAVHSLGADRQRNTEDDIWSSP